MLNDDLGRLAAVLAAATLWAGCSLFSVALSTVALAQSGGSDCREPGGRPCSVELAHRGGAAYADGDFAHAVELFSRAYEEHPEPTLLISLGRANEVLGRDHDAIAAYEQYLSVATDDVDRASIERRIAAIREQIVPEPAPPSRQTDGSLAGFAGGALATGVAGIAAGVVLGLRASSLRDDVDSAPNNAAASALLGEAQDFATGANVAFAVGGALALAAAVWLILELVSEPEASSSAGRAPAVRF